MLSMSMMPANADPPENVCIRDHRGNGVDCRILPMDEQHAVLILSPQDNSGGCHYIVSTFNTVSWQFTLDHGLEKCPLLFDEAKERVRVRGS